MQLIPNEFKYWTNKIKIQQYIFLFLSDELNENDKL